MNDADTFLKYVIEGRVEFIPSQRELTDISNGIRIKLQVPASRCFEMLLKKMGNVISQEELILCGWGEKRSSSISANTYYQCVLHLRRSLAKIKLADIITTVPRHGLRINSNFNIQRLTNIEPALNPSNDIILENSTQMEAQALLHRRKV